ncbi:unnamed protein product [Musa acuminata subsp. malaccensis]|uniref:(wild Malaysian banana) hypothetical protein n=1 Tax=Musa acuminata subsp. malaccensis TaxID=214687 RepID=A0A804JEF9_MUSAM|nr:unnamed protein product [Musa acuminata subsp. malaccensis]
MRLDQSLIYIFFMHQDTPRRYQMCMSGCFLMPWR